MNVAELLDGLKDKTICVVGDYILDYYRTFVASRMSPEAPIPILEKETQEIRNGGAGNVFDNLKGLGVNAKLISVYGDKNRDIPNYWVPFTGEDPNYIMQRDNDRLTTVKERVGTMRQQIVRIDHQSNSPITEETAKQLLVKAKPVLEKADAIIFSDYNHGVCIPELIMPIMAIALERGIPTVVDSKSKDSLSKYKGATIILPNKAEARIISRLDDEFEDVEVAKYLLKTMKLDAIAITCGPEGILFMSKDGRTSHYPTLSGHGDVVDVTGAGDTVAATVAAGLTLKLSYDCIMKLANVAAGIKVQKRGVASATPAEIIKTIEAHGIEL